MRSGTAVRVVLIAACLVGVIAPHASAQTQFPIGGLNAEGGVTAGFRFYPDKPSDKQRGKFEEYRDLPSGALLENLYLRVFKEDESYSADIGGDKWGQKDQHFYLDTGRLGVWQFGFDWDQTPHLYSTTGRTLETEGAKGVFTLPTPRPNLFLWPAAPRIDISQRWDTMKIFTAVSPTPDLDLKAEYTRIHKDGYRPYSMAFGSPGNNFLEILEPIDQTIHDVRLKGVYSRDNWQIQAGYNFSMFNQGVQSVVADNPCFGLAAAVAAGGCAADAAGAPASGRMSIEPDNYAHTFNLSGGVTLPLRTRLTANASYSLRIQDAALLPQTNNPAISSTTLNLPQTTADRSASVALLNLNATTRPLNPLTLTARYRLYDYKDMSNELAFAGHVINDRTLVVEEREALKWGYTRQNADGDARWRFGQPLALTLGAGWERWDRVSHREVPQTNEYFGKAAVDVTPVDWLLARLTYRPSVRRGDEYSTFAHHQHQVIEDIDQATLLQGQSVRLRKFDEADRDRQAANLAITLTPFDTLSTTFVGEYSNDHYGDSDLGLQEATRWGAGVDVNWQPNDRFVFFGGYMHELILQKMRSASRPVTGTSTSDFPDFDWVSVNTDTVDTVRLGADIVLLPDVLTWRNAASYAYALGRVQTRNPLGAPRSGTAAQQLTASAKPWPAFEDTLFRLDTALRYHFLKRWTASLAYAWESFEKQDWRTDTLNPFVPGSGSGSIWLGNDSRNYTAHIIALTLTYQFK